MLNAEACASVLGKPSKRTPVPPGRQSGQLLLHHLDDEGIGDELTSGHVPSRLVPQIGAGIRRRTQKITRHHPLPSHRIGEQYSLGAFTDAWRAQ